MMETLILVVGLIVTIVVISLIAYFASKDNPSW